MSDDGEDYSDNNSGSDSENEDTDTKKPTTFRPIILNKNKTVDDIIESDEDISSDDDSVVDDADEVDDVDGLFGGANEEIEGEEVIEDSDPEDSDDDEDDEIELNENGEEIENTTKQGKAVKNTKVKKTTQLIIDDEEDDDEDEYDENYLQKFETEITKNYINEFHPECFIQNYDEIAKLAVVVRNSDNIIIDPNHRTIPFLTKYEKARVLGQRAKQIETGSKPFVKITENIVDSYIIAELELREKKIPFIIRRPLPNGTCEYWYLRDLEMIGF
jgi:DNA-directed RNA polymerase I, II, and III subunit RPABC2